MNDYMLMILEDEAAQRAIPPKEIEQALQGHIRFSQSLQARGIYRDGERLRPTHEGKRVNKQGVQDGPFAESKEALGGYYVFQAANQKAAEGIAAECPRLAGDVHQVREIMKGELTRKKPGKVFAFAVIGKQAVMDRVDAATSNALPKGNLGGVRLQDGAFAESKEIVGGLFCAPMSSMDEAVRWAKSSPFMDDATLEIREVWPVS